MPLSTKKIATGRRPVPRGQKAIIPTVRTTGFAPASDAGNPVTGGESRAVMMWANTTTNAAIPRIDSIN